MSRCPLLPASVCGYGNCMHYWVWSRCFAGFQNENHLFQDLFKPKIKEDIISVQWPMMTHSYQIWGLRKYIGLMGDLIPVISLLVVLLYFHLIVIIETYGLIWTCGWIFCTLHSVLRSLFLLLKNAFFDESLPLRSMEELNIWSWVVNFLVCVNFVLVLS